MHHQVAGAYYDYSTYNTTAAAAAKKKKKKPTAEEEPAGVNDEPAGVVDEDEINVETGVVDNLRYVAKHDGVIAPGDHRRDAVGKTHADDGGGFGRNVARRHAGDELSQ